MVVSMAIVDCNYGNHWVWELDNTSDMVNNVNN